MDATQAVVPNIDKRLTCPACGQWYMDPKVLKCLHTMCCQCLEEMVELEANVSHDVTENHESAIQCPICQTHTPIPRGGVRALTSDLLTNNLLSVQALHTREARGGQPGVVRCDECVIQAPATTRCAQCLLFLCDPCTKAHQRRRLTVTHELLTLEDARDLGAGAGLSQTMCPRHPSESIKLLCKTCDVLCCRDCTLTLHAAHAKEYIDVAAANARARSFELVRSCGGDVPVLEEAINSIDDLMDRVDGRAAIVKQEVNTMIDDVRGRLEARREALLTQLESTRALKGRVLREQRTELTKALAMVRSSLEFAERSLTEGGEVEVLTLRRIVDERLLGLIDTPWECVPHEDDIIHLTVPSQAEVIKQVEDVGVIGSTSTEMFVASGEGLKSAWRWKTSTFVVKAMLPDGTARQVGGDHVESWVRVGAEKVFATVVDNDDGTYVVTWVPLIAGDHYVSVTVSAMHIKGSPFRVPVRPCRNWQQVPSTCLFKYGTLGTAPGEVRNPMGVTVDTEGRTVVAESTNHRIQVFTKEGLVVAHFGSHGAGSGRLRGPCGVAVDHSGNILVADEGNHRICVFTASGEFIRSFGGGPDVAVQERTDIVDRFSSMMARRGEASSGPGSAASPFGRRAGAGGGAASMIGGVGKIVGAGRGEATSPRTLGVAAMGSDPSNGDGGGGGGSATSPRPAGGSMSSSFKSPGPGASRLQGAGGAAAQGEESLQTGTRGVLCRPWGVAVDVEGRVVVTEFGRHRVTVFDGAGQLLRSFGEYGTRAGQLCSPTGVAVNANGEYVVVDQGNHRVQVFSPEGVAIRHWGTQGTGDNQFQSPAGVACDPEGHIVVADAGNNRVCVFEPSGSLACTFGSQGTDDGKFRTPMGIAFDGDRRLIVAEWGGNRVQVF